MADELNLQTKLTSTADTSGATEMSSGLSGVGTAAETVKTQVDALIESFVALFALSELISFFKDAAEAAYDHEKALRGVAQAALIAGADMTTAKAEADTFTSALSLQTGVLKTDLLDAYAKVYLATGQVTEAEKEVTLAANLATVRHLDMVTALRLVESAATGVPGRFDRIVGGVTEGTTAFEKHVSMTQRLIKAYGDVSQVTNDAAMEQDRANVRWREFKDNIGEGVQKAILGVRDGLVFTKDAVLLLVGQFENWIVTTTKGVGNLATYLVNVWKGPAAAWKAFQDENAKINADHNAASAALEDAATKNYVKNEAAKTAAVVKELDFRGKTEKVALDANLRNVMSEKEAEMRAADAAEIYLSKDEEKGVNDRLKLAQKEAAEKLKIEKELQARTKQIGQENLAESKTQLGAELKQFAEVQKQKLDLEATVVNQGLQMAGDAFGIGKEIAIAEAVINTYAGAAKALSQGGIYGAILAALVIAVGLEDIAQIASQSAPTSSAISAGTIQSVSGSPAGFDDPSNDQAAYVGGAKWAKDMIGKFSGGASAAVSQGWAGGMGAGSTTNNTSKVTNNFHIGGNVNPNDREFMKQLVRKLAMVQQSDSQRTIARRS